MFFTKLELLYHDDDLYF